MSDLPKTNPKTTRKRRTAYKVGFWELMRQSVIVQALLTLFIWVTILYLYATGKVVPDTLLFAGSTILGFYFGAKVQNLVQKGTNDGSKL